MKSEANRPGVLQSVARFSTLSIQFEHLCAGDRPSIDASATVMVGRQSGECGGPEFTGCRRSCLLPDATLLAQHWDVRVAEQVGTLPAEEAAAHDAHVVLGPTINLHRTPLGGRLFETFSEDPLLTGALANGSYDADRSRELPPPDSPARRAQVRRLAAAGMTVLVNRDGALPLAADTRTMAVIGRHAVETTDANRVDGVRREM